MKNQFYHIITGLIVLFISLCSNNSYSQSVTLFDPNTYNPANLPAGMSIVDIDGEKYLKAPLNEWNTYIEIDPFFISSEVTHLIFTAKYKSGTSGYTPEQTTSFFQFLPSDWSENVNDNPHSSAELVSHRIPFDKPSGMSCGIIQLAGRETVSGNWNVLSGDTIFLGKVRTYSNDPTAIFDPNYYENVDMPVGMSIVQIENERYLQVITNGWSSILSVPQFDISQGYSATCNVKYSMGNATADTLNQNQIQSMIVLIDNENTMQNPWGEGEIEARLTLVQNPAPSEMANLSGEFIPEMQYVDRIQFAGQQTVNWSSTTGDTLWVGKIEQIYIAPPLHAEVRKTATAPLIDGIEEKCWNGVEAIPLERNFVGEEPTVNAYWKAMWADSGLFVLVNVQDDNHYPAWEAGSVETWNYDLSEVVLDVNSVLDDGLGARHNQGHYQYLGSFLKEQYGSPIINELFTYANQLSGENRISEYYIPFSQLQNKNGNLLNKDSLLLLDAIGFDVCVTDQDQGITDRRYRKVWCNIGTTNENYSYMDDAGTIKLVDEPVHISDSVLVTFRVDMRDEPIGPMGVNLIGSFNDWTSIFAMTCTFDKVYEITLELPKNQYFEYKFRNGEMWEFPEGNCNAGGGNTNRTLNVASENLILDLVCYNSCFLCPPSHIEVAKTETAPVLDGVIDDVWNNINAIPVSKNYLWENPTVNAYWKAIWADTGIFVLIDVQDDVHFPAWEAGSIANWEYDLVEVYFDVNENLLDGRGSRDGSGHYSYSPVFEDTKYGTIQNTDQVSYSNLLYDESFVSEMFFPFTSFSNNSGQYLSKFELTKLANIGFDVYVIDRDSAETNRQRKVWQNNGLVSENWANMNDAGTIKLMGEDPNAGMLNDSLALVALYNATGGDNWYRKTNWLTGPLNTWQDVTVENGRVVGLNLGWDNNLVGTLPAEIGNLTAIKWLIASGNNGLTGSIPVEIGNLRNLETLLFYNNNLTGTIPNVILNLNKLASIEFSFNNFDAAPMPDFGQLTQLRTLTIENCNFTGDIPAGLSNLTSLVNLYMNNNQGLNAGPIPDLSNLPNIINLGMAGCNRTGTIPAWITQLVNLETLNLSGNSLTGNIPATFSNAAYIRELDFGWNPFTAASLPDFSSFERLEKMILAGCNLNGTVPQWVSTLVNLEDLNVSYNMLEGALPENIGNLTNMEFLNIEANRLSGSLPASISNMENLKEFYLNNNQFSGNMPVMTDLSQLFILRNSNNKYTFANIAATGRVPGDITHFVYSPQDTILGLEHIVATNSLTVIDGKATNNSYQWYENSNIIPGAINDTLVNIQPNTAYQCKINNATFNFLELQSEIFETQAPCNPDWQVVNYTNSTTAYCKITIDGVPASDQDKVGAFVGNECRAIGNVVINNGVAYSTLVIQGESVETINFKIWDASICQALDACNTIQSNPGGNIGYPPNYIEVDVCLEVTQTIHLVPGWNLVSFYVETDPKTAHELFSEAPCSIKQVKTITKSWDPNAPAFLNTLTELNNTNVPGFFVNSNGNCTLEVTGNYIGNDHSRDKLASGWNLIGYPFQTSQVLTSAYAALLANDRLVQVKNISSSFDPAVPEHLNTLESIEPGEGYFIKVNSLVENFEYPAPTAAAAPNIDADGLKSSMSNQALASNGAQPSWTLVTYTNSTTAYGIVTIDGNPAEADDWVGAFVGNECRAMQQVIMNEGIAYANLNIQGESAETVSFKVWDASHDRDCEVALAIQSNPGTILGYPDYLDIAASSVPNNLPVNNRTLSGTECFNAQNDITVAGTSDVVIQDDATATFIAGHSIRFLPGFHAQQGSYVDAHITTTGSFCDDLPAPIMAAEPVVEKSATEPIADENENQPSSLNACMKVYPNPNNGQFTVSFDNFDNETKVYVYNTFGQKVYQTSTWEKFTVVELQHVRRGIYFVKAINNQRHYEQKIIVQ